MRIALGVEYDGSGFRGFQTQGVGVPTVQRCLEQALTAVAAHPVAVTCAGRTDAGVHAGGQVVHFDSDADRPLRAWVMGGNAHLPDAISIIWAQPVPDSFHARFSALARCYRYIIINRAVRSALLRQRVTWWYQPLDAERMHLAGQALLGEHDFSSYRAQGCQSRSPMRCVHELTVTRYGDYIVLDIEANAFLQHMVRNIVGVLLAIGAGERPLDWARAVLELRDRTLGGVTAPPDGLSLIAVRYPPEFALLSAVGAGAPPAVFW